MVDNLSKEARSENMRAIRSKGTSLEAKVSKELWRIGYRFRRNVKGMYGKPDFAIKKYKLVVFIDSCFWHGCPIHYRIPKSNEEYWRSKIERNKQHDSLVTCYYEESGWTVIRIWEHQIKDDFNGVIARIVDAVEDRKSFRG